MAAISREEEQKIREWQKKHPGPSPKTHEEIRRERLTELECEMADNMRELRKAHRKWRR